MRLQTRARRAVEGTVIGLAGPQTTGLKDLRKIDRFWGGPLPVVSRLFIRARPVLRRPPIFGTSSAGRAVTCGCS